MGFGAVANPKKIAEVLVKVFVVWGMVRAGRRLKLWRLL